MATHCSHTVDEGSGTVDSCSKWWQVGVLMLRCDVPLMDGDKPHHMVCRCMATNDSTTTKSVLRSMIMNGALIVSVDDGSRAPRGR